MYFPFNTLNCSSIQVWFGSLLNVFNISYSFFPPYSSFLNIQNTVINTVLTSLSDNSNIYVSPWLGFNWLIYLLIMGQIFLPLFMPDNLLKIDFIFYVSCRFTLQLSRRYRIFPHTLCPHTCRASTWSTTNYYQHLL